MRRCATCWWSNRQKLALAFSYDKYPWGPGEVLRYSSVNTFLLAAAMDGFLKRQVGPKAHLWDIVVADVFQPIGVFHLPARHTQELDGSRGIPPLGYGLYPTVGDRKTRRCCTTRGGIRPAAAGRRQTGRGVVPDRSQRAAQWPEEPVRRGPLPPVILVRATRVLAVPSRSPIWPDGGRLVVLLPNGITAFRFTDGHSRDMEAMVLAGEAIRAFPCPAGSPETLPPALR